VVSSTPWPQFTPGKDPVPIVQEAGLAPGPVWTDAENLASTGIRSPDRPARSQSPYRLSYPAHLTLNVLYNNLSRVVRSRTKRKPTPTLRATPSSYGVSYHTGSCRYHIKHVEKLTATERWKFIFILSINSNHGSRFTYTKYSMSLHL
jgi:hypothetical protein